MQLALSENAQREYKKIPKQQKAKIKKKLSSIEKEPYSGKKLGGELTMYYSVRAWPYRIIYTMDKEKKKIYVEKIQHRQGAYK